MTKSELPNAMTFNETFLRMIKVSNHSSHNVEVAYCNDTNVDDGRK